MKKFAAVALTVAALTLSACTPATSTPVAAPSPSQAAPSPSQAPISVPTTAPAPVVPAPTVTTAPAPCEEDEPCWDCATMGNMICGPVEAPAQSAQAVQPVPAPAPVFKGVPVTVNPVIPPHAEPAPVTRTREEFCVNPWLGGAWAGWELFCANLKGKPDVAVGPGTTPPPPATVQPRKGKVEGQSCTITGC